MMIRLEIDSSANSLRCRYTFEEVSRPPVAGLGEIVRAGAFGEFGEALRWNFAPGDTIVTWDSPAPIYSEDVNHRARKLLVSCLTPEQKREFEHEKTITVRGESGLKYKIRKGEVYNILVLPRPGEEPIFLCGGPENVPIYDFMLAQKLWLENDEEGFLRVANFSNSQDVVGVTVHEAATALREFCLSGS